MPEPVRLELPPERDPEKLGAGALCFEVARVLGCKPSDLAAVRLRRISFDARRDHLTWLVQAEAWRAGETVPPEPVYAPPVIAPAPPDAPRAVVVGMGPAGLFCALDLARSGLRVALLDRGKDVQARRRDIAALHRGEAVDPDSNYAFGEGGAGTYSDGKLYTRSLKRGPVREVLETLVAHGAPEQILVSWRPHVGSNLLPKVVAALRKTLQRAGVDVRFEARAVALEAAGGAVRAVRLESGETLPADAVVLATGHSALDALLLAREVGAQLEPKGFAMGVRVEHPQDWVDERQYRGARDRAELPPAFYELATRAQERGVYSFCMCPGGWVVPSHTNPNTLVVNGMSLSRRDSPFANSGVVVEVNPEDWAGKRGARWGWPQLLKRAAALSDHPLLHEVLRPGGAAPVDVAAGRLPAHPEQDPLFGVRLQLALEVVAAEVGGGGNRAPAQRADHFMAAAGETAPPLPSSYRPGLVPADFNAFLPPGLAARLQEAMRAFDRRMPGFTGPRGQLIGVETRTSSPVRIARDRETLESPTLAGLVPCGEGAGFAGGIVSAALDGRRCAAALVRKHQPHAAARESASESG